MDLLTATDHTSYCPFKGTARYWSIGVGARGAEMPCGPMTNRTTRRCRCAVTSPSIPTASTGSRSTNDPIK